jgi:hypothetical protein
MKRKVDGIELAFNEHGRVVQFSIPLPGLKNLTPAELERFRKGLEVAANHLLQELHWPLVEGQIVAQYTFKASTLALRTGFLDRPARPKPN